MMWRLLVAGPSAVFAAYELINKNANAKIIMIEEGNDIYKRTCPISEGKGITLYPL